MCYNVIHHTSTLGYIPEQVRTYAICILGLVILIFILVLIGLIYILTDNKRRRTRNVVVKGPMGPPGKCGERGEDGPPGRSSGGYDGVALTTVLTLERNDFFCDM